MQFPKVAQLRTPAGLLSHWQKLGFSWPVDDRIWTAAEGSPMARPLRVGERTVGNRWCIHPMEGWDGTIDGHPTDWTRRRWRRFGESGAKLIWGGEAAAVQPDGRANPQQLMATQMHLESWRQLLGLLKEGHREAMTKLGQSGEPDDLLVGLQLTHSGRYARPHGKALEPRIAFHHPLLDQRVGIDPGDDSLMWTDQQLEALGDRFVDSARVAWAAGFDFVDVKACHGYLMHELLGARDRAGRFGGDLDGRSRLLRSIIERIREEIPQLIVGVRLSLYDAIPFQRQGDHGEPMSWEPGRPYELGFGVDPQDPTKPDLTEPIALLRLLQKSGVQMVNLTSGSPYYTPHLQRPAAFPPSDGYPPPEDPLAGVARHLEMAKRCKDAIADLVMVGSGYTYLQDFLPHVAQGSVRSGAIDCVGLGRMVLSYPHLPVDTLSGTAVQRKLVCRTFSDCTTAPRKGLISGCYPLDRHYKDSPEAAELAKRLADNPSPS